MKRRDLLKSALAGAAVLAAPRVLRAESAKTITFTPHADLVSLDPVWTTADITRNFSLAVYDTLYGYDASFQVQPQMVDGATVENDGKQWDLKLRDGLAFHDGTPVLARDCVATIQRFAKRNAFGEALMARTDESSAVSDKVIRFRLKKPFALLPNALAGVYCAIMPERLAKTDANSQVTEAMGSGPVKFVAAERLPGQRVVYEKNDKYVPRASGTPSFSGFRRPLFSGAIGKTSGDITDDGVRYPPSSSIPTISLSSFDNWRGDTSQNKSAKLR
jgi:peptide/nickel transport system substrate-binding protein